MHRGETIDLDAIMKRAVKEVSSEPRWRLIIEETGQEVRQYDVLTTIYGEEIEIASISHRSRQVRIAKNGRGCLISPKIIKAVWRVA